MFEQTPETERPSEKKGPTQISNVVGCLVIGLVILFFGVVIFGSTILLEIPYQLAVGWILFLMSNVAALELNWEMTACGVGALLAAVFGFHRLLVWVRKENSWKWSWTLSLATLVLMLFAASISMTGIIHQLGWMAREPLTQSNRRGAMIVNVSNAKQMFYLLIEYDQDHGELPPNLQTLGDEGYTKALSEYQFHPGRMRPSEPWIYLGAEKSFCFIDEGASDSVAAPPKVLLISPVAVRGRWIILRNDGAVRQVTNSIIHKEYPQLVERLPGLFQR